MKIYKIWMKPKFLLNFFALQACICASFFLLQSFEPEDGGIMNL
jgi:hypothetical protein